MYGSYKTVAGWGLAFSALLAAILVLTPLNTTANAAGNEYTGLSAGCSSYNNDDYSSTDPSCTIAVHRKGAPDLVGTYDEKNSRLDNLDGIVQIGEGYSTVYASYTIGGIGRIYNDLSSSNAAIYPMTRYTAFSLVNPPASTASMMQMPTTGAPEGLTAIGVTAIGIGLLGLALAGLRRQRQ